MGQSYLKQRENREHIDHYWSICLLKYAVLSCSLISAFVLLVNLGDHNGLCWLFLVPLLFGFYFFFSKLKNYFMNSIPFSFFIAVLLARYLATPLIMTISGNLSAMFNGAATSVRQQQIGVFLMVYEMVCIFITIEICVKKSQNRKMNLSTQKLPYNYPSTILVLAIAIGIASIFLFPQLLDDFNFLFVKASISVANRNTIIAILSYFAEFAQIFVFIIVVKSCIRRKNDNRNYSIFVLLIVATLNISLMWSANRMTIFLVAGTTLSLILYYFPERRKIFFTAILMLSIIMVIFLSSYRLFGSTGATISTDFANQLKLNKLASDLQIYFAGPDSIAGAVGVKDFYGNLITGRTFLIDSFGAVNFIQQLPIIKSAASDATFRMFDYFCSNGYYRGLIISMVGQGYIYFGAILAPIFSVISVILLFLSDRASQNTNDVAYKYVLTLLTFNFALFPMYNYTLIMQNVFGRIIPLFLIVWLNKYIYFRRTSMDTRMIDNVDIC